MGRIINPEKYLRGLLKEGQSYYVGFGLSTLTKEGKNLFGISDLLSSKTQNIKVTGRKGPLKENINGKYVREEPQSKITIEKHIEYYSTYHKKDISYDREYNIWKKVLLHKYELRLYKSTSPQTETIIHFTKFKFEISDAHYYMVKAAMNIAIIIGDYFQLYNINFEPVLPINEHLHRKVLGKGVGSVKENLAEITERLQKGEYGDINKEGNSYRFALLQDHNITNIKDGIGGFNDYIQFEFKHDDIVILENLQNGHATYIFKLSKFENDYLFDKQNAKSHCSFITRVIHHNIKEWERIITKYISMKSNGNDNELSESI
jgi:hypothetical protein